ncbi:MAG: hypothetical protein J5710_00130 [Treponema sp.]|nr:hypothetical protein [Treponema sp.]
MKNTKLKELLLVVGEAFLIAGITVAAVIPVSCKITEQGITVVGGDYVPPVLNTFHVEDENTITLTFSEKVEITDYVVTLATDDLFASEEHSSTIDLSPALERLSGVYGSVPCNVVYKEDEPVIQFVLEQQMEIGQNYQLYAQACDPIGNTLTLAIPFTGFNSRVPELMITEVQTESVSQNKAEKTSGIYRNEFVELLVLKSGNLAGLELCSGYDGEAKKYSFPAIEVTAGEIILVHMRNRGNGCISEEDDDLTLATASYTSPEIRDLWTDIETTTLGNKTDIIIIRNHSDNRLLDALMFRESSVEAWTKTMADYSQFLDESEIYLSGDIENAFIADALTTTKTLHRTDASTYRQQILDGIILDYPISSSAEVWCVSDPSPGTL